MDLTEIMNKFRNQKKINMRNSESDFSISEQNLIEELEEICENINLRFLSEGKDGINGKVFFIESVKLLSYENLLLKDKESNYEKFSLRRQMKNWILGGKFFSKEYIKNRK